MFWIFNFNNFTYYNFLKVESIKNILKNGNLRGVEDTKVSKVTEDTQDVVWTPKTHYSLFLTGKTGVGKTYKAKQILQEAMEDWDKNRGFSQAFAKEIYKLYSCQELMLYSRIPREAARIYEEAIRCRLIVLDDLGIGKKSDFTPDLIYMIVDKRLDLNRATIVTSNLKLSEISELIDDRLASRLASFEYEEITGEDRRLNINNKQNGR